MFLLGKYFTWYVMQHISLPLSALLGPLVALAALATESHRDLAHGVHHTSHHDDADLDAGGVHQGRVQELGGAARLVLRPALSRPGARAVFYKGPENRLK